MSRLILIPSQGIVAWPVAKLLEFALGPHHGIIYRRAELKELIAMHSNVGELGGDLKMDTVNIIGEVLDLQEKVNLWFNSAKRLAKSESGCKTSDDAY